MVIKHSHETYFTPYDDAQTALISLISSAKKKIRIAIYSFNIPALANLLVQKFKEGVDVSLCMDKTQSAGKSEVPEVQILKDAKIPLVIGTSEKHKILHDKFAVIDDSIVASGSYNFTLPAESEDNFLDIIYDLERAKAFTQTWQKMYDFIKENEPQT